MRNSDAGLRCWRRGMLMDQKNRHEGAALSLDRIAYGCRMPECAKGSHGVCGSRCDLNILPVVT